jgi:NADP-dependent 3-hydroxy acid dehydrogenase YdfG
MGSLTGTVAMVTGASSGIGRATVHALAERGATVCAVARRAERLTELVDEAGAAGGTVVPIECDVSDRAQVRAAVAQTVERFGRLDILVNNAGLMLLGSVAESDVDEWERMARTNLLGCMYFVDAGLDPLAKAARDEPRHVADIVNIGSVAGRLWRQGGGAYSATKAGVCAFSESLRQETADQHIRVSVIEPGVVDTELFSHNRPGVLERIGSRFGAIRRLDPQDIARTVAFILEQPWYVALNEIVIRPTEQADKAG